MATESKRFVAGFALAIASIAGPAHAAGIPVCGDSQLLGYAPKADEVAAHRGFTVPTITHRYGAMSLTDPWGLEVTMRIDESGSVQCYTLSNGWEGQVAVPLNKQRLALIESMKQWRYRPFVRDGKPLVAIVTEDVAEEEAPRVAVPLPSVPLEKVHIRLERTACFGTCPVYSVDVYGDGRVVYKGVEHVAVTREHTWRIPPQRVAELVASARAKDLWSLRKRYWAPITDHPAYTLTLDFGDRSRRIEDYAGRMVGMPQSVTEFEDEIDEASGATGWVRLGPQAVEQLKIAGFDFTSPAGGELLRRTATNELAQDDAAALRLVELGAPTQGVIDLALLYHRAALVDALIERGALESNGAPDQEKIDAAFRAAITGGRLALVQKIGSLAGSAPRPSLTFDDVSEDKAVRLQSPVTLLLRHYAFEETGWEGLAIARWLAAQGCDLKARGAEGQTLLHIATDAGDLQFVRYLLEQGFDPSTQGRYGLPALGSAEDEDIAMTLLQAGTDLSLMCDKNNQFRRYAESQHWGRVIAWLDSH